MTKRLYFTCPIKALYMAKEFGVKFCRFMTYKDNPKVIYDSSDEITTNDPQDYMYRLLEYLMLKNVSVDPESEHIFEPTHEDQGIIIGRSEMVLVYYYKINDIRKWYTIDEIERVEKGEKCEIVLRNGKQFFAAEVEEDA
jgi:hypothetical protein